MNDYSLIADSSDRGSHGGQKKSNIESKVTLQILSPVDSTGKNIGVISGRIITARASSEMVVSSVLITGDGDKYANSRTKWILAVSVRNVRRIRNVESSNVAVGGLCLLNAFSFDREFCWNRTVYLLFCDLNLISIHDSGRAIVWAKGSKTLKRVTVYCFCL